MSERYQSGDNIHLESLFLTSSKTPETTGSGIIYVRRASDDMYFNGSSWQSSRISQPMIEISTAQASGWWNYDFDTSNLSGDDELTFEVYDENNKAKNAPQFATALIGGYVDFIDTPISSGAVSGLPNETLLAAIIATSGALVTEINENEAKLDTLIAGQIAISGLVDELEGFTDTLESGQAHISGMLDTLEAGQTDICNKILATSGILVSGQTSIISEINDNEAKLDTLIAGQIAISGLVDELEGFTDTIESGQATLIAGQTDICNKILATSGVLESEINDNEALLINISGVVDTLTTGQTDICNKIIATSGALVTEIDENETLLVAISGFTDTLESGQASILSAGGDNNALLVAISGFTDELEGMVDTLESGQATLMSEHSDICDKIVATSGALVSEINENESLLVAISGFTDGLQGDLTTALAEIQENQDLLTAISGFTDSLESGQSDIMSNIDDNEALLVAISGFTDTLESGQSTLMAEHADICAKILATSGTLLTEINANEAKLDLIISTQTILSGMIDTVIDNTDTLESGQVTIISEINENQALIEDILDGQSSISGIVDILESGQIVISGLVDELEDLTDTLESGQATIIDCTNQLKDGQTAISGLVDELEGFTDTLESGHADICNKILATSGVLSSGQTNIISEIDDNEVKIDQLISDQAIISGLVNDIHGFTDTLESGQATLEAGHTDICNKIIATSGALSGQLDDIIAGSGVNNALLTQIISDIAVISGFTDTLEDGQADICAKIISTSGTLESEINANEAKLDQLLSDVIIISGLVDTLESGQATLMSEHADICQKILDASGVIVTEINENETKIDEILVNQGTISGLIDELEGFTDTIESGQATLISGQADICQKILDASGVIVSEINENESLLNDILDGQSAISGITDVLESGQVTLSGLIDQLEQGHVTISGFVDTLESGQTVIIDCTDQLKDGQTIISGLVDDIEGLTDTLESGQITIINDIANLELNQASISGQLDDVCDKIIATSGALVVEINENEAKLDTALSGLTQILTDIVAMSGSIPNDVWTFATRTLTSVSGLQINIDASGVNEIASGVWNYPERILTGEFVLGDGSVIVDHNFESTDNLRVLNSGDSQPIDNALITAFFKSDYDAGNTGNQYIKAQTRTRADGRWFAAINLDPGTYTLFISKQTIFLSETIEITVT